VVVHKEYRKLCDNDELNLGEMHVWDNSNISNPRVIINFPTKYHWKIPSDYQIIEDGLVALVKVIQERKIASIAIPALGCGLGGLHWKKVRPMIEKACESIPDVNVLLYPPHRRW
jgi:O-acetyl-ADP-ribose deacetylase (regulator of RNase III)